MPSNEDEGLEALIRRNMARFRAEAELSLREAAGAAGISLDYLSKMERGERSIPTATTLKKLADLYGHKVDHFYLESPPAADPTLLPAFSVVVIGKNVPQDLVDRMNALVADLNEEHRERLAKMKAQRPTVPAPPRAKTRGTSAD